MGDPIRDRIELVQGDITESDLDAIVNAADTELRLDAGVAAAIAKAGGPSIATECAARAPIALGAAAVTGAGEIGVRFLIHAASMEPGGKATEASLRQAVRSALTLVDHCGARTVALPAIGTGVGGLEVRRGAEILLEEAAIALHELHVEHVRFVLFDEATRAVFTEVLGSLDLRVHPGKVVLDALTGLVRDVPDFPKPGIVFKDITPLLSSTWALTAVTRRLARPFLDARIDQVFGIEARGFIFGPLVAKELQCGFVPVRKKGKLPHDVVSHTYDLEYGTDTIEIHSDAIRKGDNVLVIDDVLATGGTAAAAGDLVEKVGGEVVGYGFLMELDFLDGRRKLGAKPVEAVLHY